MRPLLVVLALASFIFASGAQAATSTSGEKNWELSGLGIMDFGSTAITPAPSATVSGGTGFGAGGLLTRYFGKRLGIQIGGLYIPRPMVQSASTITAPYLIIPVTLRARFRILSFYAG